MGYDEGYPVQSPFMKERTQGGEFTVPSQTGIISLNLILDYPVRWSKYKVLRDFIQNFYDAIGYRKWQKNFHYRIEEQTLKLTGWGIGFSPDWLMHIGASTKRDNEGAYAGYFGEGFKIASLCAFRDHGWNVGMASRQWSLTVTTTEVTVDGRQLRTLAYDMCYYPQGREDTVLVLENFSEQDEMILKAALHSFYYPENPLFGKVIWESLRVAVYHRSKMPLPHFYPVTYGEKGEGIVFSSYQAMGTFQQPLVICVHNRKSHDRDRNNFYKMDVVTLLEHLSRELPPEAAKEVLLVFKKYWYSYPSKQYDFDSYYPVVRQLVTRIADSREVTQSFLQQYPDLLVAQSVKRCDTVSYNRRRQALVWLRNSKQKHSLVQDGFLKLGYTTLEKECERNNGFNLVRQPTQHESRLISLLEKTVNDIMPGFFGSHSLPPCTVILNEEAVWAGMTSCLPVKNPQENSLGLIIKFELSYVAIQEDMLRKGCFGQALSTFFHELAHMFGGDRSAPFSQALTYILDLALRHSAIISQIEREWDDRAMVHPLR